MSGLRERQKQQRREAILEAALGLFDDQGFAATTVEQIAERTGVSIPTVFNYFGSKQDILLAVVEQADLRAVNDAQLSMPAFDNAVDAMCHLEALIVQHELQVLPPSIWRELLPLGLVGPKPATVLPLNARLVEEIARLLRDLQARQLLNQAIDVDFVAYFLNDYSSMQFMRLVQEDPPDFTAHQARVRQMTQMLFDGLAPRPTTP